MSEVVAATVETDGGTGVSRETTHGENKVVNFETSRDLSSVEDMETETQVKGQEVTETVKVKDQKSESSEVKVETEIIEYIETKQTDDDVEFDDEGLRSVKTIEVNTGDEQKSGNGTQEETSVDSEGSVEIKDTEIIEMISGEETVVETSPIVKSEGQGQQKTKGKSGSSTKGKGKKSAAEESYTIVIKVAQGGVKEGDPVTMETMTLPTEVQGQSQRTGLRPREPRKTEVKQIIVKQEEEDDEDEDEEEMEEEIDDQQVDEIDPKLRESLINEIMSKQLASGQTDQPLTAEEKAAALADDLLSGRPVRPVERQKMRPWMIELLDRNNVPGLSWQNRRERIFRISWKHAAHNCFNRDRDSDLFERWAIHTGRHYEGNHKRWKANFRCALNSLPDVIELRDLGVRKGDNAFKVYKFLDLNDPVYKDRIDNKGKKSSGLAGGKVRGVQQKYVSKTEKYLRTIITRRLKKEAEGNQDVPTVVDDDDDDDEDMEGLEEVSQTVEIEDTPEGGTLQTLLQAIELQQEKMAKEDTTQNQAATGHVTPGKRPGPPLKTDSQSAPKRIRQGKDGNILITPGIGGAIEQMDGNILLKLDVGQGTSTAVISSAGVVGSSGGTYVMAVGSTSNPVTSTPKVMTPVVQGQTSDRTVTSGATVTTTGQSVVSVLPVKLPYLEQKSGKITIVQVQNAKTDKQDGQNVEGKLVEGMTIPADIQTLLRQRVQESGVQGSGVQGQGQAGTGVMVAKGIEQKITFPVGGKAMSLAGSEKQGEVTGITNLPTVGLINTGNSERGQEQRITIPLSQWTAMMNQSQPQKYGITINLDGKMSKELSTVSTSLASGGSVLSSGITANLVQPTSIPLSVNTTLQNGGQGQTYVTLMAGGNQGQIMTPALSTLGTLTTGQALKSATGKNIPSTVLEAMDLKTLTSLSKQPDSQKSGKNETAGSQGQTLLSPTKHTVNKDITSLAEALKSRPPQSLKQVLPVPTDVSNSMNTSMSSASPRGVEIPGVRNKLVTRLLISGAATTTSHTVRPAVPSVGVTTANIQPQPTFNLVFQPNQQLPVVPNAQISAVPAAQLPVPGSGTPVLLTKQQLSMLTASGVIVGQALNPGQLTKTENVQVTPPTTPVILGVTPPVTPGVQSPATKPSTPRAESPNGRPELMEQVTIDLKEIGEDPPPVEGETTTSTNSTTPIITGASMSKRNLHQTPSTLICRSPLQGIAAPIGQTTAVMSPPSQRSSPLTSEALKSPSTATRTLTRTVMTQCNLYLMEQLDNFKSVRKQTANPPRHSSPVETVSSGTQTLRVPTKNMLMQCSLIPVKQTKSEKVSSLLNVRHSHVITEAEEVLREHKAYSCLDSKVVTVDSQRKRQVLVITNNKYFGLLGKDLDPLTFSLSSNGFSTLSVLFKPVVSMRLIAKSTSSVSKHFQLDVDGFKNILEKIATFHLCPGITPSNYNLKGFVPNTVEEFTSPFLRYQARNCPVWFQSYEQKRIKAQCEHCKNVVEELEKMQQTAIGMLTQIRKENPAAEISIGIAVDGVSKETSRDGGDSSDENTLLDNESVEENSVLSMSQEKSSQSNLYKESSTFVSQKRDKKLKASKEVIESSVAQKASSLSTGVGESRGTSRKKPTLGRQKIKNVRVEEDSRKLKKKNNLLAGDESLGATGDMDRQGSPSGDTTGKLASRKQRAVQSTTNAGIDEQAMETTSADAQNQANKPGSEVSRDKNHSMKQSVRNCVEISTSNSNSVSHVLEENLDNFVRTRGMNSDLIETLADNENAEFGLVSKSSPEIIIENVALESDESGVEGDLSGNGSLPVDRCGDGPTSLLVDRCGDRMTSLPVDKCGDGPTSELSSLPGELPGVNVESEDDTNVTYIAVTVKVEEEN